MEDEECFFPDGTSIREPNVDNCTKILNRQRDINKQSKCFNDPSEEDADLFYRKAEDYWRNIPPTLSGVLGGYEDISNIELPSSHSFLKGIFKMSVPPGHVRAVDCGAGIGRVTKGLLQKYFGRVDLVEQSQQFLDKAKELLGPSPKIGNLICTGLQHFSPPSNTYDVVWCQWVLGHLTDQDLESFFVRMASSLRTNGVIVVKENISQEAVELDKEDSSITRPECLLLEIFRKAGLRVIRNMKQNNLPEFLYDVRMFCLKPEKTASQ